LSAEARRTASALDDSPGPVHAPPQFHAPPERGSTSHEPAGNEPARNEPASAAVIRAMHELSSSRELQSDPRTLVAIGGSATMSLPRFEQFPAEPTSAPSASSMRFMETALAFVALLVALLLNLGR
jgi:hypothetical protein